MRKKQLCMLTLGLLSNITWATASVDASNTAKQALKESNKISLTVAESETSKANNSEASKYGSFGDFSVNERTGSANIKIALPAIGSINLTLIADSASMLSKTNYLGLGAGWYFSGLPFITKENGKEILIASGQRYIYDQDYTSIGQDGTLIHSGLRYQVTKQMHFVKEIGTLKVEGGKLAYGYELSYANGTRLYFNSNGLLIAAADGFFVNDQAGNQKHLTRVYYQGNSSVSASLAQVDHITDGNNESVYFRYLAGEIRLTYPINASGKALHAYIKKSGDKITAIQSDFSENYRVGMRFDYDQGVMLNRATETVFDQNGTPLSAHKTYQLTYDKNTLRINRMLAYNPENIKEYVATAYRYIGLYQPKFKFGEDTSITLGLLNNNALDKTSYSTEVTQGNTVTTHHYNFLHNEIETQTSVISKTGEHFIVSNIKNTYNAVAHDAKGNAKLLSSYQQATTQETTAFDNGVAVSKSKTITDYNDYLNPVSVKSYAPVSVNKNYAQAVTQTDITYDNRHQTPVLKVTTDNSTKRQVSEKTVLDASGLLPLQQSTNYKDLTTGKVKTPEIKRFSYASDTSGCGNFYIQGLVCKESVESNGDTLNKSFHYDYSAIKNGYGKLAITTTNDLNQTTSRQNIGSLEIASTDALGNLEQKQYAVNGMLLETISPRGHKASQKVNLLPDSKLNSTLLLTKTDALGVEVVQGQNWMSNPSYNKQPNEKKTGYSQGSDHYSYDGYAQLESKTDKYGNKEYYTYDMYHRPIEVKAVDALGKTINILKTSYQQICDDEFGCYQKVVQDQNNDHGKGVHTVEYSKGKLSLYKEETIAGKLSKKQRSYYSDSGQLQEDKIYDPNNPNNILSDKHYYYDTLGRNNVTETTVNGHNYRQVTLYDETTGKETQKIIYQDGKEVHRSYERVYDRFGRLQHLCYDLIDTAGKHKLCTTNEYNDLGQLIASTDFNGATTNYTYDKFGKLLDEKHDGNDVIKYTYDSYGRLKTKQNAVDTQRYFYTKMGNLLNLKVGDKTISVLSYNDKNDLNDVTDAVGNRFTYHNLADSKISSIDSNLGKITYSYYDFDNDKPLQNDKIKQELTQFDNGQVKGTLQKDYDYDDQGRLHTKTTCDDKGNCLSVTTNYDNRGQIIKEVSEDTTAGNTLTKTTDYTYDDQSRLLSSKTVLSSGHTISNAYNYDGNSNITSEVQCIDAKCDYMSYDYNNIDQLLTRTVESNGKKSITSYQYDKNGNVIVEKSGN